jgi:hypothetical protein
LLVNISIIIVNEDGKNIMTSYFKKVASEAMRKEFDDTTKRLLKELEEIASYNLVKSAEASE